MKYLVLTMILLAGVAVADTEKEINHLLEFVAASPCQFDRNGTIHNGPEARDHMNMKYEHYRKKVKTAEDFIKYSATRSKLSGRKYKIHCPDSSEMNSSDWLLNELKAFRKSEQG